MQRMNTKADFICENCHIVFDTRKMKTHRVYLKDEEKTMIRFWSCPYCGKRVLVSVANTEIRKMIKDHKKIPAIKARESIAIQKHKNEIDKILEGKDEKIHK